MSITGELRKWAGGSTISSWTMEHLIAIADRIDETYKKAVRELNGYASDSVLLPRDGDGEVIHVGDMMEYGKARGHVIALMLSNYPKKWGGELHWGVQLEGEQAPTALNAFFHHYHEPTVEDVLAEFFEEVGDGLHTLKAVDTQAIIAEYAAKLRLAGDAE